MARDFTNFDAGCHGPVPLEARIFFSFPWSPLDVRAPSVARVGTRRARSHGRRRTRQEFREPAWRRSWRSPWSSGGRHLQPRL